MYQWRWHEAFRVVMAFAFSLSFVTIHIVEVARTVRMHVLTYTSVMHAIACMQASSNARPLYSCSLILFLLFKFLFLVWQAGEKPLGRRWGGTGVYVHVQVLHMEIVKKSIHFCMFVMRHQIPYPPRGQDDKHATARSPSAGKSRLRGRQRSGTYPSQQSKPN